MSKRVLPRRAHTSNQYAPKQPKSILDIVDDLLVNAPTYESVYLEKAGKGKLQAVRTRTYDDSEDDDSKEDTENEDSSSVRGGVTSDEDEARPQKRKASALNRPKETTKRTQEPPKSAKAAQKTTPPRRKSTGSSKPHGNSRDQQAYSIPSDNSSDPKPNPLRRSPRRNSTGSSKQHRKSQDQEAVSVNSDSPSASTPSPPRHKSTSSSKQHRNSRDQEAVSVNSDNSSDIHTAKEQRRVQDANRRQTESNSNTLISGLHRRLETMKQTSEQQCTIIDQKQNEIDELRQRMARLEHDHANTRAALQHVRNNPAELLEQATKKKKGPKTIKSARALQKSEKGSSNAKSTLVDLCEGKDTVKTVYRTFKFINNEQQEEMFVEAMLNNLGKSELLFQPTDTDERKAKVKENRKETRDMWSAY